jgi:Rps23 Pro-64 3,4-dihydroxylase Tpa1-like proline 4-hydroxylase
MPTETAELDQPKLLEPASPVRHGRAARKVGLRRGRVKNNWAFERPNRLIGANESQSIDQQSPFFFDPAIVSPLGRSMARTFSEASPFPHVVIDDLLPNELLGQVVAEVPDADDERWAKFENSKSHRKLAIADDGLLGPQTRHLLGQLNSAVFIDFLEKLSGTSGLVPDLHHEGGGLQEIGSGGFLKIHTDLPFHRSTKLDRQLNVLLYLNSDWDESWGGDFELWNDEMTRHDSVAPLFNRMVIFATPHAKHGHPDPLLCPEGIFRRALVMHYYSTTSIEFEREGTTRRHYARPGEVLREEPGIEKRGAQVSRAREFVPPALVRVASGLRRRVAGAS